MSILELQQSKMTAPNFTDAVTTLNTFLRKEGYNLRFRVWEQEGTELESFVVSVRYVVDYEQAGTYHFFTRREALNFMVTTVLDWVISLSEV